MLNSIIKKVDDFLLSISTYEGEEQDKIDSESRLARIAELENGGAARRSDAPSQKLMDEVERFMSLRTQN